MGGLRDDVEIPIGNVMFGNLTLKGKWMYERSEVKALVRMVESGLLGLRGTTRRFPLEEWDKAFTAAEGAAVGENVVFVP